MNSKKLRKLDEVNGWKVNHPHSGANFAYMFFTLILIAAPLIYLFLPNVYGANKETPFVANPDSSFMAVDLFKDVYEMLKGLITHTDASCTNIFIVALCSPAYTGELLAGYVPYFFMAASILMLLIYLFAFIMLIIFIVHLIKGYLRHSKSIKVLGVFEFIFSLLYSLIFLIVMIGFNYSAVGSSGDYVLNIWTPFFITAGIMIILIILSIIYGRKFKDSIPENDLEIHDEPTVEHISKVHEVTKVKYVASSTIPSDIVNIGGHEFAENQNLVVANIPNKITKLGNGAFANCLNLKVVTLPSELVSIGYNCFFNCASLERINYAGTKAEWRKISRGSNWLFKAKTTEVYCADGPIIVNPHH